MPGPAGIVPVAARSRLTLGRRLVPTVNAAGTHVIPPEPLDAAEGPPVMHSEAPVVRLGEGGQVAGQRLDALAVAAVDLQADAQQDLLIVHLGVGEEEGGEGRREGAREGGREGSPR